MDWSTLHHIASVAGALGSLVFLGFAARRLILHGLRRSAPYAFTAALFAVLQAWGEPRYSVTLFFDMASGIGLGMVLVACVLWLSHQRPTT